MISPYANFSEVIAEFSELIEEVSKMAPEAYQFGSKIEEIAGQCCYYTKEQFVNGLAEGGAASSASPIAPATRS